MERGQNIVLSKAGPINIAAFDLTSRGPIHHGSSSSISVPTDVVMAGGSAMDRPQTPASTAAGWLMVCATSAQPPLDACAPNRRLQPAHSCRCYSAMRIQCRGARPSPSPQQTLLVYQNVRKYLPAEQLHTCMPTWHKIPPLSVDSTRGPRLQCRKACLPGCC